MHNPLRTTIRSGGLEVLGVLPIVGLLLWIGPRRYPGSEPLGWQWRAGIFAVLAVAWVWRAFRTEVVEVHGETILLRILLFGIGISTRSMALAEVDTIEVVERSSLFARRSQFAVTLGHETLDLPLNHVAALQVAEDLREMVAEAQGSSAL